MIAAFQDILRGAVFALQASGAIVIVATTFVVLINVGITLIRHQDFAWRYEHSLMGRGLVFGLELLIGADILATILIPTLTELAVLGAVIVLRTILALSIMYEIREEVYPRRSREPSPREADEPE